MLMSLTAVLETISYELVLISFSQYYSFIYSRNAIHAFIPNTFIYTQYQRANLFVKC